MIYHSKNSLAWASTSTAANINIAALVLQKALKYSTDKILQCILLPGPDIIVSTGAMSLNPGLDLASISLLRY